MTSVEVVLVRHGQTSSNAARRFGGLQDPPLDETGHAQAAALAASWPHGPFDAVWCSTLQRAAQTARALHPEPRAHAALVELDQGVLDGLTLPEAVARHGDEVMVWLRDAVETPLPGGESLRQARDRAWAALNEIAAEARAAGHQRVVVVAHQLVIAVVVCTAAEEPLGQWRERTLANCGAVALCFHQGGVSLVPATSPAAQAPPTR
jgi:broad specificity phosphatase PhoE